MCAAPVVGCASILVRSQLTQWMITIKEKIQQFAVQNHFSGGVGYEFKLALFTSLYP